MGQTCPQLDQALKAWPDWWRGAQQAILVVRCSWDPYLEPCADVPPWGSLKLQMREWDLLDCGVSYLSTACRDHRSMLVRTGSPPLSSQSSSGLVRRVGLPGHSLACCSPDVV